MHNTLTKAQIAEVIFNKLASRHTHREIKAIVEKLFDLMSLALKKDNLLLLSGFGKFECYAKHSRRGRNPHTREAIVLPARKVVVFRLSRVFKQKLNG